MLRVRRRSIDSSGGTWGLCVARDGVLTGKALAERVLVQMRRLALDLTLTAGVVLIGADPSEAVNAARAAAGSVPAGQIGTRG